MACGREETEVVIALAAEDGSGQGGTATLTRQKAQTQVFIKVNPAPQGDDPQPVHIHFGSCGANLGAVDVSLNDIVAGESVTLANASLSSLRSGSRVINVHRSYDEISIYTACGGIPNN